MMPLIWRLKPAQIRNRLMMIALIIGIVSIITEYLVEINLASSSNVILVDVLNIFSVNLEASIPTWFATILLFVSTTLLAFITMAKFHEADSYRWHWLGLALGFLYLSIDEGAGLHELFVEPMKQAFNPSGFFAFGWQIVAIPVVILIGLVYLRFILHLPARTRIWLIVSAGFYLGGALMVEGLSASLWDTNNSNISMAYLAVATIEEVCEKIGIICFIFTLLDMMQEQAYGFGLYSISSDSAAQKEQPPQRIPLLIPLLILLNALVLGWMILTPQPEIPPDTEIFVEVPFYYAVEDQILADGGVIMEMQGIFGIDNPFSRQLAATLLEEYPNVIAVAQPTEHITSLIATKTLLLSRDDLTTLLHNIGQTNFIIFETETVQAISRVQE